MAVIEVQPIVVNDLVLHLGDTTTGNDFQKAISSAILTPSSSNVTFQGGTPDAAFTFPGSTTWALELTYAQDVSTPGSLSEFLWTNRGQQLAFTLEPKAGGTSWDGEVIIAPGAAGGAVSAVATSTVSLGVQGEPTPTFPTV